MKSSSETGVSRKRSFCKLASPRELGEGLVREVEVVNTERVQFLYRRELGQPLGGPFPFPLDDDMDLGAPINRVGCHPRPETLQALDRPLR